MRPHLPHPERRLTSSKIRKAGKFRSAVIDSAIEGLDRYTIEVLADLFARGDHSPAPDGFPTSSMSGGSSSDVSRPTESAVVALFAYPQDEDGPGERRMFVDPIGDAVSDFKSYANEVRWLVQEMDRLYSVVVNAADTLREIQEEHRPDECRACAEQVSGRRDDRLKSGYCGRCYARWRRLPVADRDRAHFENRVRSELSETEPQHQGVAS